MSERDVTMADLTHLITENLPSGWEFCLSLREGEIDMELFDPDGNLIKRDHSELSFNEMVLDLLNHARQSDGLGPVELDGEPGLAGPTDREYRRAIEGNDEDCPECVGLGRDDDGDPCGTCGGHGMVASALRPKAEPSGRPPGPPSVPMPKCRLCSMPFKSHDRFGNREGCPGYSDGVAR